MTPEQQQIAIAEAHGWKRYRAVNKNFDEWIEPSGKRHFGWETPDSVPDYPNDLNAMHEAEKVLRVDQKTEYIRLINSGDFSFRTLAFATAGQRAEAFLRTLNLWVEQ